MKKGHFSYHSIYVETFGKTRHSEENLSEIKKKYYFSEICCYIGSGRVDTAIWMHYLDAH